MKQMMTISGGILFAVAMISLIFGGATFVQIIQFQNELESRGQVNKTLSEWTGIEKFNKQEMKGKQDAMVASLATAGIFGSVGIGLAVAGRSKTTQI
ncbi:hypothetical protein SD80_003175 [Scytonema tolypothrichoides VB-61278]|nr:hypothetical protein SD80_003175 [Scytonema tolypothrichoides VB-61278]